MKKVPIHRSSYAIIDDEDYIEISKYKWRADGFGYPITNLKIGKMWTTISLHRLLMNAKNGEQVDHKNRNILDNRRNNLRKCDNAQNRQNKGVQSNNSSGFKGVYFHKRDKKYRAKLMANGKIVLEKCFDSKIEAAKAYNEAAKKYHGEYAFLNKV